MFRNAILLLLNVILSDAGRFARESPSGVEGPLRLFTPATMLKGVFSTVAASSVVYEDRSTDVSHLVNVVNL